jgi:hypothetical protein
MQTDITLNASVNNKKNTVYGWGNVTKQYGVPVIDSKGGYIPFDVLAKAVKQFTEESGRVQLQHESLDAPVRGKIVQSFMLNAEIARSMGIDTCTEGWMVEIEVEDETAWEVVQTGCINGLSLGGTMQIVSSEQELERALEDPNAEPQDVRLVTNLVINELSLVVAPANPLSTVSLVTQLSSEDTMTATKEQLQRIEELEAKLSTLQASNETLAKEKEAIALQLSELEKKAEVKQEPEPTPVTVETVLSALDAKSAVIVQELAEAKVKAEREVGELKVQLEAIQTSQRKAEIETQLSEITLSDEVKAELLPVLLANGKGNDVIVSALKSMQDKVDKVAISLGAKPKSKMACSADSDADEMPLAGGKKKKVDYEKALKAEKQKALKAQGGV